MNVWQWIILYVGTLIASAGAAMLWKETGRPDRDRDGAPLFGVLWVLSWLALTFFLVD